MVEEVDLPCFPQGTRTLLLDGRLGQDVRQGGLEEGVEQLFSTLRCKSDGSISLPDLINYHLTTVQCQGVRTCTTHQELPQVDNIS